jgi:hypothetical protein
MMIVQRGRSPDRSSAPRSYRERSRSPRYYDAWRYADNHHFDDARRTDVHHRRRRRDAHHRRTDERDRRRRRHEGLSRDSLRAREAERLASDNRALAAVAAHAARVIAARDEAARGAALAAAVNHVLDVPAFFAIDVPAAVEGDDAAPFAIDVPAYRRELVCRQRDANALAVVAAADVRNRAEIVSHPLDASARLAEIAAVRWNVHRQEHDDYYAARHADESRADAIIANQQQRDQYSVANIDDATRFEARRAAAERADAAAAEGETTAAEVALWEHAHNVDIVNGDVVAMWDHLPGLQGDAASAAADVLAHQEAEALVTQLELEAFDICCGVCYNAKDLQELACTHSFCRKCIRTFVTPVCPFCRRPL